MLLCVAPCAHRPVVQKGGPADSCDAGPTCALEGSGVVGRQAYLPLLRAPHRHFTKYIFSLYREPLCLFYFITDFFLNFFFNFYLFMIVTERQRERGRDIGRGRSRLHALGGRRGIRGIRSLVSRITPWAKGRRQTAAPPRDPPTWAFLRSLNIHVEPLYLRTTHLGEGK